MPSTAFPSVEYISATLCANCSCKASIACVVSAIFFSAASRSSGDNCDKITSTSLSDRLLLLSGISFFISSSKACFCALNSGLFFTFSSMIAFTSSADIDSKTLFITASAPATLRIEPAICIPCTNSPPIAFPLIGLFVSSSARVLFASFWAFSNAKSVALSTSSNIFSSAVYSSKTFGEINDCGISEGAASATGNKPSGLYGFSSIPTAGCSDSDLALDFCSIMPGVIKSNNLAPSTSTGEVNGYTGSPHSLVLGCSCFGCAIATSPKILSRLGLSSVFVITYPAPCIFVPNISSKLGLLSFAIYVYFIF